MNATTTTRRIAAVVLAAGLGVLTACQPFPGPFPGGDHGTNPAGDPAGDPGHPNDEIDRHPPQMEIPIDAAGNDMNGSGRAIMLRVMHTPDPQFPHRMSLEKQRVYVRYSDTGPIQVTTYDFEGKTIDSWFAPDPLTKGETPRNDSDEARYGIPYSVNLARVEIRDVRTGASTEAKVDEVVRQFCESDPTDNICRDIDLTSNVGLDHYDPRVMKVGESMTVPVFVRVHNDGTDWARVGGSMFQFGFNDHTTFSTTDPTTFAIDPLDPGQRTNMTVNYTLTCTSQGDDRIFVGAQFYDGAREAIDSNPANNRWNTWFDIHCDPAA